MSGTGARLWNIAETTYVVKRRTETGEKVVNNYRLLQTIGQGRFSKVKLCERLVNSGVADAANGWADGNSAVVSLPLPAFAPPKASLFAMKIYSKKMLRRLKDYCTEKPLGRDTDTDLDAVPIKMRTVTALDRVRDEIQIMRSLYHRNIVLLYEVIEADNSDKLFLVLEYMASGPCMVYRADRKDFYSRVTGSVLSEDLARSYLSDILLGLQYLHLRRVCHRDIKPDNILVSGSGRCHMSDFNCAKVFCGGPTGGFAGDDDDNAADQVFVSDTVGTYQFLAPECCSGDPYNPFKADIWAVGVVFYIFLSGRLPFASESTRGLFEEILHADILLPERCGRELPLSCEGSNLLFRLLEKYPANRITIEDALSHPWFVQIEEDEQPLSF
ncbi:camkk protein kinase [Plasmopara halstedii]|uniref:Camkk protein kinase n=1 Tax=Plasmopara halstedii TaxID=4781 RepID=A0A0P1AE13_PLAHL|nr:camkk protein kinase [Plasmopara halstedii]CEG39281.1 camkk protein kinase [Plasmopara halstedii]|eukprot:XP_024575650.1 camkk protein kinase [Plasmopara halstedii]